MAKKIIEFSAKLNTADFEKAFKALNDKIQNITAPMQASKAGNLLRERMQSMGFIPMTDQDRNKMQQQENLRRKTATELEREAQKQYRALQKQDELEERMKRRQDEVRKKKTETLNEELMKRKEIERIEEKLDKLSNNKIARQQALNKILDESQGLKQQQGQGMGLLTGGGRSWSPGFGIPAIGGYLGAGAAMGGAVLAAAAGVAKAQKYLASRPIRLIQAQGETMSEAARQSGLQAIYTGGILEHTAFSSERMQALSEARQFRDTISMDKAKQRGISIEKTGLMPGVGYLSAVLPAIFNSPDQIDALMSAMGSSSAQKRLSQLEEAETLRMAANTEAALISRDPLKKFAVEERSKRRSRDFDLQKTLGFRDDEMYGRGGFFSGDIGLTEEEKIAASRGILGAGGSTMAARNLSGLAARAERAGIASGTANIGRLSGLMNLADSEQSFRRLLGEGVRQGLDHSEFRAENSKFQEILTAAVISTGGGADTAARTAAFMGSLLPDRTMGGIQGAQTAATLIESLTGGNEGVNAQVRGATLMSKYGSLGLANLSFLQNAGISKLTEDNPRMRAIYDKAVETGLVPPDMNYEDFVSDVRRDVGRSMTVNKGTREAMERYRGIENPSEGQTGELLSALALDIGTDRFDKLDMKTQRAFANFVKEGDFGAATELVERESSRVEEMLARGTEGLGQKELEGLANAQKVSIELFRDMEPALNRAAEAARNFNKAMLELGLKATASEAGKQVIPEAGKSR